MFVFSLSIMTQITKKSADCKIYTTQDGKTPENCPYLTQNCGCALNSTAERDISMCPLYKLRPGTNQNDCLQQCAPGDFIFRDECYVQCPNQLDFLEAGQRGATFSCAPSCSSGLFRDIGGLPVCIQVSSCQAATQVKTSFGIINGQTMYKCQDCSQLGAFTYDILQICTRQCKYHDSMNQQCFQLANGNRDITKCPKYRIISGSSVECLSSCSGLYSYWIADECFQECPTQQKFYTTSLECQNNVPNFYIINNGLYQLVSQCQIPNAIAPDKQCYLCLNKQILAQNRTCLDSCDFQSDTHICLLDSFGNRNVGLCPYYTEGQPNICSNSCNQLYLGPVCVSKCPTGQLIDQNVCSATCIGSQQQQEWQSINGIEQLVCVSNCAFFNSISDPNLCINVCNHPKFTKTQNYCGDCIDYTDYDTLSCTSICTGVILNGICSNQPCNQAVTYFSQFYQNLYAVFVYNNAGTCTSSCEYYNQNLVDCEVSCAYIKYDTNIRKVCDPCSQSNERIWPGQICNTTQCNFIDSQYPFTNSLTRECVKSCPKFINDIKTMICVSSCSGPFSYEVFNSQSLRYCRDYSICYALNWYSAFDNAPLCLFNCPFLKIENSTAPGYYYCVGANNCSFFRQSTDKIDYCVKKCDNTEFLRQVMYKGHLLDQCVKSCRLTIDSLVDTNMKRCVSSCGSDLLMSSADKCVDINDFDVFCDVVLSDASNCVPPSCNVSFPISSIDVTSVCVNICDQNSLYKYLEGNICKTSCQSKAYSSVDNRCITDLINDCPNFIMTEFGMQCVPACTQLHELVLGQNQCVSTCSTPFQFGNECIYSYCDLTSASCTMLCYYKVVIEIATNLWACKDIFDLNQCQYLVLDISCIVQPCYACAISCPVIVENRICENSCSVFNIVNGDNICTSCDAVSETITQIGPNSKCQRCIQLTLAQNNECIQEIECYYKANNICYDLPGSNPTIPISLCSHFTYENQYGICSTQCPTFKLQIQFSTGVFYQCVQQCTYPNQFVDGDLCVSQCSYGFYNVLNQCQQSCLFVSSFNFNLCDQCLDVSKRFTFAINNQIVKICNLCDTGQKLIALSQSVTSFYCFPFCYFNSHSSVFCSDLDCKESVNIFQWDSNQQLMVYNDNNICVISCSFYIISIIGQKTCVSSCQNFGYFHYLSGECTACLILEERKYLDTCTLNQCVSQDKFDDFNRTCADTCSYAVLGNTCVDSCDIFNGYGKISVSIHSTAVFQCIQDANTCPFIDDITKNCQLSCMTYKIPTNTATFTCSQYCDTFFDQDQVCYNSCPYYTGVGPFICHFSCNIIDNIQSYHGAALCRNNCGETMQYPSSVGCSYVCDLLEPFLDSGTCQNSCPTSTFIVKSIGLYCQVMSCLVIGSNEIQHYLFSAQKTCKLCNDWIDLQNMCTSSCDFRTWVSNDEGEVIMITSLLSVDVQSRSCATITGARDTSTCMFYTQLGNLNDNTPPYKCIGCLSSYLRASFSPTNILCCLKCPNTWSVHPDSVDCILSNQCQFVGGSEIQTGVFNSISQPLCVRVCNGPGQFLNAQDPFNANLAVSCSSCTGNGEVQFKIPTTVQKYCSISSSVAFLSKTNLFTIPLVDTTTCLSDGNFMVTDHFCMDIPCVDIADIVIDPLLNDKIYFYQSNAQCQSSCVFYSTVPNSITTRNCYMLQSECPILKPYKKVVLSENWCSQCNQKDGFIYISTGISECIPNCALTSDKKFYEQFIEDQIPKYRCIASCSTGFVENDGKCDYKRCDPYIFNGQESRYHSNPSLWGDLTLLIGYKEGNLFGQPVFMCYPACSQNEAYDAADFHDAGDGIQVPKCILQCTDNRPKQQIRFIFSGFWTWSGIDCVLSDDTKKYHYKYDCSSSYQLHSYPCYGPSNSIDSNYVSYNFFSRSGQLPQQHSGYSYQCNDWDWHMEGQTHTFYDCVSNAVNEELRLGNTDIPVPLSSCKGYGQGYIKSNRFDFQIDFQCNYCPHRVRDSTPIVSYTADPRVGFSPYGSGGVNKCIEFCPVSHPYKYENSTNGLQSYFECLDHCDFLNSNKICINQCADPTFASETMLVSLVVDIGTVQVSIAICHETCSLRLEIGNVVPSIPLQSNHRQCAILQDCASKFLQQIDDSSTFECVSECYGDYYSLFVFEIDGMYICSMSCNGNTAAYEIQSPFGTIDVKVCLNYCKFYGDLYHGIRICQPSCTQLIIVQDQLLLCAAMCLSQQQIELQSVYSSIIYNAQTINFVCINSCNSYLYYDSQNNAFQCIESCNNQYFITNGSYKYCVTSCLDAQQLHQYVNGIAQYECLSPNNCNFILNLQNIPSPGDNLCNLTCNGAYTEQVIGSTNILSCEYGCMLVDRQNLIKTVPKCIPGCITPYIIKKSVNLNDQVGVFECVDISACDFVSSDGKYCQNDCFSMGLCYNDGPTFLDASITTRICLTLCSLLDFSLSYLGIPKQVNSCIQQYSFAAQNGITYCVSLTQCQIINSGICIEVLNQQFFECYDDLIPLVYDTNCQYVSGDLQVSKYQFLQKQSPCLTVVRNIQGQQQQCLQNCTFVDSQMNCIESCEGEFYGYQQKTISSNIYVECVSSCSYYDFSNIYNGSPKCVLSCTYSQPFGAGYRCLDSNECEFSVVSGNEHLCENNCNLNTWGYSISSIYKICEKNSLLLDFGQSYLGVPLVVTNCPDQRPFKNQISGLVYECVATCSFIDDSSIVDLICRATCDYENSGYVEFSPFSITAYVCVKHCQSACDQNIKYLGTSICTGTSIILNQLTYSSSCPTNWNCPSYTNYNFTCPWIRPFVHENPNTKECTNQCEFVDQLFACLSDCPLSIYGDSVGYVVTNFNVHTFKLCVSQCPDLYDYSQQYMGIPKCVTSCQQSKIQYKFSQNLLDVITVCVTQCNFVAKQILNNGYYLCQDHCLGYDSTFTTVIDPDNSSMVMHICETDCANQMSTIDFHFGIPKCAQSSCQYPTPFYQAINQSNSHQCVSTCKIVDQNKNCLTQCIGSNPGYRNQSIEGITVSVCYNACPVDYALYDYNNMYIGLPQCVIDCQDYVYQGVSIKYFTHNGVCQQQCDYYDYEIANKLQQRTCTSCSLFSTNKQCLNANNVELCQADQVWQNNQCYGPGSGPDSKCLFFRDTPFENNGICTNECPSFVNITTKICMNSCQIFIRINESIAGQLVLSQYCVLQCPSDKYESTVAPGQIECVNECPPTQFIFQQACSVFCPSKTYQWQNGFRHCVAPTCLVYLRINSDLTDEMHECHNRCNETSNKYNVQNGTRYYCVKQCSNSQFYYQNESCVNTCDGGYYYENLVYVNLSPQYQRNCSSQCPQFKYKIGALYNLLYKCVPQCLPQQYRLDNTNECVDYCEDPYKYVNMDTKTCFITCPLKFYKSALTENGIIAKICINQCEDFNDLTKELVFHNIVSQNEIECINCNDIRNQSSCIQISNCREIVESSICVTECSRGLSYILDQQCIAECPNKSYKQVENRKICQLSCDNFFILHEDYKECVSSCAQFTYGQQCVDTCPNGIVHGKICNNCAVSECVEYIEQTLSDEIGLIICLLACSYSQFGNILQYDTHCVKLCPQDKNLIENNICVSSCQNGVLDKQSNQCLSNCWWYEDVFYDDSGQISSVQRFCMTNRQGGLQNDCGQWFIVDPLLKQCSKQCAYFIQSDGVTCSSTCLPGEFYKWSLGIKHCLTVGCIGYLGINEDIDNVYEQCVENCNELPTNHYTSGVLCVSQCPITNNQMIMDDANNCLSLLSQCSVYTRSQQTTYELFVCSSSCAGNRALYGKECVLKCPISMYRDEGVCSSICSQKLFYETDNENVCASQQCQYYHIQSDTQKKCQIDACLSIGDPDRQGYYQCVDSCPTAFVWDTTLCVQDCDLSDPKCRSVCNILQGKQCIISCDAPNLLKNMGYYQLCQNCLFVSQGSCVDSCLDSFETVLSQNRCIICQQFKDFSLSKLGVPECVAACQNQTFDVNNYCVTTCNFVNEIGQCVETCSTGYIQSGNKKVCVTSCSIFDTSQQHLSVSLCQSNCVAPHYFIKYDNNKATCVESCNFVKNVYGSLICTDSCQSYNIKSVFGVQYYQCVSCGDQLCVTNCYYGLDFYKGVQICVDQCQFYTITSGLVICAQSCIFINIVNGKSYCQDNCTGYYSISSNIRQCQLQCIDFVNMDSSIGAAYECVTQCPSQYYSQDGALKVCEASCEFVSESDSSMCSQSCSYYKVVGQDKKCQSSCGLTDQLYNNVPKCVVSCPPENPLIYQGQCTDYCPIVQYQGSSYYCVNQCDKALQTLTIGVFIYQECVDCNDYVNNGRCVAACPSDKPYYQVIQLVKYCVERCDSVTGQQCISCASTSYSDIRVTSPICQVCNAFVYNEQCVDSCPPAKPFKSSGVCSGSCEFFADANDDLLCLDSCSSGYVVGKMGQFICRTCALTDPFVSFMAAALCVDSCPSARPSKLPRSGGYDCGVCDYVDQSQVCTVCSSLYYTSATGQKVCVGACPSSLLVSGSECVELCPTAAPYTQNGRCVAVCYFVQNGFCLDDCAKFVVINGQNVCWDCPLVDGGVTFRGAALCVDACGSARPFSRNGVCAASCDQYADQYACVAACPSKVYQNVNVNLIVQKTCVEKCSFIQAIDSTVSVCLDKCPKYVDNNYCVDTCNFVDGIHCTSQCRFFWYEKDSAKICDNNCAGVIKENQCYLGQDRCKYFNMYENHGICVSSCENYRDGQICTDHCDIAVGLQQECVDSCDLYLFVGNQKQCVNSCQDLFKQNNECVSICASGLYKRQNSQNICVDTCEKTQLSGNQKECLDQISKLSATVQQKTFADIFLYLCAGAAILMLSILLGFIYYRNKTK